MVKKRLVAQSSIKLVKSYDLSTDIGVDPCDTK